jgi:hypothetical protein
MVTIFSVFVTERHEVTIDKRRSRALPSLATWRPHRSNPQGLLCSASGGSIPVRLTSLINTAPRGFTLHPALGAISLRHISRGGEHPP